MKKILICMDPDGHSQKRFLTGAAEVVQPNPDWSVVFDLSPERLTLDRWRSYEEGGIRGAIVCETNIPDLDAIIAQTRIPLVIFGATRETRGSKHAPHGFVMSDDVGIGVLGARYFLSCGKAQSYGYVPHPDDPGWSRGHLQGFEQAIRAAGGTVNVFLGPNYGAERQRQLEKRLVGLPKPAAVMASCDTLGIETIAACKSAEIDVPRQVAVLGVGNNVFIDEFQQPSLTSIGGNGEEVGRQGALLLGSLMRARRPWKVRTVQSKAIRLFQRESTGPVAPAAHLIRRATTFISDNAGRDIKVADVVHHCHVSRRLLDLRFHQFLGKSVNVAIQEARLAEVKSRLLITDLPFSKLAASCGFDNPAYLRKLLRAKYGESLAPLLQRRRPCVE